MNKSIKYNSIIEALGWYGTFAIVLAYGLLSLDIIDDGLIYQLLNATGAIGLIIVSYSKRNYQPVVLNIIWLIIGLGALISLLI